MKIYCKECGNFEYGFTKTTYPDDGVIHQCKKCGHIYSEHDFDEMAKQQKQTFAKNMADISGIYTTLRTDFFAACGHKLTFEHLEYLHNYLERMYTKSLYSKNILKLSVDAIFNKHSERNKSIHYENCVILSDKTNCPFLLELSETIFYIKNFEEGVIIHE